MTHTSTPIMKNALGASVTNAFSGNQPPWLTGSKIW